jgi:hypothetical protein
MSWSIQAIGKPEAVKSAIDKAIEGYGPKAPNNQSRAEFEEAQPHLHGLLDLIVGASNVVKLSASGHASFVDGAKTQGTCSVAIETLYGFVE